MPRNSLKNPPLFLLQNTPDKTRIKRQVTGNRLNVNLDDFADGLTNIDVTRVVPSGSGGRGRGSSSSSSSPHSHSSLVCERDANALPCDHTNRYRTLNGWCNNLNNPQYGKSVTPLVRFLSAKYDDGECFEFYFFPTLFVKTRGVAYYVRENNFVERPSELSPLGLALPPFFVAQ